MNYQTKIKFKMALYAAYFVIGIITIFIAFYSKSDFLSPLGLSFSVIGIAKFIRAFGILKNPELMRNAEISESDERNIYIYHRAKSLSFTLMSIFAAIGIIVSGIMNEPIVMKTLSYFLCVALIIYLISYCVIRRKS